jgi:SPP1 gp7 family putative phage head morphogenesis protein
MVNGGWPMANSSFEFQSKFADELAAYLAAANLVGRLHTMQIVKKTTGDAPKLNTLVSFADDGTTVLGFKSVPFEEAIARIRNLTGYTKLAFDGLKQKYRMSGVHDRRHARRAADRERARRADERWKRRNVDDFRKAVMKLDGADAIGRTHLETVFQTNVQGAYQNGKLEQMSDPAVLAVMDVWQYRTAGDARVRPAHAALDGFSALHDDPVWRRIYPPCGYNCRCTVIPLSRDEAPRTRSSRAWRGCRWRRASVPDPGFGGF